jgi:hypothetical protein
MRTMRLFAGCALLAAIFALGCGNSESLYDVTGTVSFNDKPVPKGLIFFDPDPVKGTPGTQGFANIVDGKYSTRDQGKGIRGGAYIVRVAGFNGITGDEAPFGQPLFPEHTEPRDLEKKHSQLDIAVPARKK